MAYRIGNYFPTGIPPVPPFLPTDLTGLQIWHRGDGPLWQDTARTLAVTTNGQTVKAWDDKSGLGNHSLGGSSTLTWSAASNAGGNNLPALFIPSGNGTFLVTNITMPSTFNVFCVWQTAYTSGIGRALSGNSTNWLMGPRNDVSGGGGLERASYYAGSFAGFGPTTTANVSLIHFVNQTNGSTGTHWVNGVQVSGNVASSGAPGALRINDGESTNGYISEIIIYNRALNATERSQVERYLGTRYNISVP